jgi:2-polyprenyl-3-methyl-5-hydroxy-6-metoxy-1,4-benzoquinol methylase
MVEEPAASHHRTVEQRPSKKGHVFQASWVNAGGLKPRMSQLSPHVSGKRVLDVGCTSAFKREDWIHAGIAKVASTVVGVDIDPIAVAAVNQEGYDVRLSDAELLDIPEMFEVVHAGELIEHLDNPRAFLAASYSRLEAGGRLVLTTPNPFAISNFIYRMGGSARVNADHTCWYCEDTLRQLLERNRFEVVATEYLVHQPASMWRKALTWPLRRALADRLAWNTLLVVARPVHP